MSSSDDCQLLVFLRCQAISHFLSASPHCLLIVSSVTPHNLHNDSFVQIAVDCSDVILAW